MSATATRPATNALDQRRLGIAMGALILAVALLVVATVSRQVTIETPQIPASVSTSVTHDSGAITSTLRAPAELKVYGTNDGGLNWTGIPYPAPAPADSDPGPRERFAR